MPYVPTQFWNGNLGAAQTALISPTGSQRAIVTSMSMCPVANIKGSLFLNPNAVWFGGCLAHDKVMENAQQYLWQGFYVLEAGDSLQWHFPDTGQAGAAYTQVSGLLGDGVIPGLGLPFRLLATLNAVGDNNLYTATAKTIVKTITVTNFGSAPTTYMVRIAGAAPLVPYYGIIRPQETKQFDLSQVVNIGQTISAAVGGGQAVAFSVHGVQV